MKAQARPIVWWPGLDMDMEDMVRSCPDCADSQRSPKTVPPSLCPWATEPWQRIYIGFVDVKGQNLLMVSDSHSNWL